MTPHKISTTLIEALAKGPSPTKITQVSAMQNYIQNLLGDTHHTFLQGSYKNDTAISDINDVDIVAIRLKTYSGVYSSQPVSNFVYWDTIFSEIEKILREQKLYTWTVTRGDKCIEVRGAFNADIIPAVQVSDHLTDPIAIYSFRAQAEKQNWPRAHYKNGVLKNNVTKDRYKPTVRIFKNWVSNHFGSNKEIISSFKMEALVHAIPNEKFYDDYAGSFIVGADTILKKLNARSTMPLIIPSVCGGEDITTNWGLSGRNMFTRKLTESLSHALTAYNAESSAVADASWELAFNT